MAPGVLLADVLPVYKNEHVQKKKEKEKEKEENLQIFALMWSCLWEFSSENLWHPIWHLMELLFLPSDKLLTI